MPHHTAHTQHNTHRHTQHNTESHTTSHGERKRKRQKKKKEKEDRERGEDGRGETRQEKRSGEQTRDKMKKKREEIRIFLEKMFENAQIRHMNKPNMFRKDVKIYRSKDVPWRVKCRRMVEHVYSVLCFGSENGSWTKKTLARSSCCPSTSTRIHCVFRQQEDGVYGRILLLTGYEPNAYDLKETYVESYTESLPPSRSSPSKGSSRT